MTMMPSALEALTRRYDTILDELDAGALTTAQAMQAVEANTVTDAAGNIWAYNPEGTLTVRRPGSATARPCSDISQFVANVDAGSAPDNAGTPDSRAGTAGGARRTPPAASTAPPAGLFDPAPQLPPDPINRGDGSHSFPGLQASGQTHHSQPPWMRPPQGAVDDQATLAAALFNDEPDTGTSAVAPQHAPAQARIRQSLPGSGIVAIMTRNKYLVIVIAVGILLIIGALVSGCSATVNTSTQPASGGTFTDSTSQSTVAPDR